MKRNVTFGENMVCLTVCILALSVVLVGCTTTPYLLEPDAAHMASARRHTGIPSVAVAPSGRLWATWYGSPTGGEDSNNYCTLATSDDRGETWRDVLVADPDGIGPKRAFDPEVWVSPEGRLFWTWTERVAPLQGETTHPNAGCLADPKNDRLMCVEFDADAVPSAPYPEPRQIARGVMMCKPTVLDDGTWLFPSAHWGEAPSACFYASADGGRTFTLRGGATLPQVNREYDEHTVTQLANGDLLTFIRAEKGTNTFTSVSHDRGRTWSPAVPAAFRHTTSRIFVRKLRSGNVLLVKHGAIGEDCGRSKLTAYLSADDGRTWKGGLLIDSRKFASYPDGDQAADGTIYLVYDYDRLGEQEVLLVRFTEADVLAGKMVSDGDPRRRYVTSRRKKSGSDYPPARISSVGGAVAAPDVTRSRPRLGELAERKGPDGFRLLYGIGPVLQIASDTAAVMANRNVYTPWGQVDFEDGTDIFVIRSLDGLKTARPIACTRSGVVADADYGGGDRYHVNYGMFGGFVPFGAKLCGKGHPGAGTGFGICQITSHPVATNGTFSWQMPGRVSRRLEVFALAYDGAKFTARLDARFGAGEPLRIGDTGWTFGCGGLGTAIPDGEDLLLPSVAMRHEVDGDVCGLSRWRFGDGKWRPVDFMPVTGGGRGEPSVVRLATGALLFAARDDHKKQPGKPNWGKGNQQDLHAWLSEDNGRTWTERVAVADVRMCSPVALGRANDGSAYFAGNPGYPEPILGERRNRLNVWPLSGGLDALGKPVTIRNAKTDFTSGCGSWNIDHPIYSVIRFADGRLHGLLSYRVRDWWTDPKTGKGIARPSADAGLYVEEVSGRGPDLPVWEFADGPAPVAIEHVAICVPDPAATVAWWVANMGFRVTMRRAGGSAFIADPSGKVAFEVYGPGKDVSAPDYWKMDILQLHFGFGSEDVDADVARLTAAGAKLVIRQSVPGFEEAVLRDPSGLVIQLVRREKSVL